MVVSLTYYENTFEDLIQCIPFTPDKCRPQNRGTAKSNGIETSFLWNLSRVVQIEGNYTYNDTEDSESSFYLQRRPLNKYSLSFHLNPHGRGRLSVHVLHVGKRVEWADNDFDGKPDQQVPLSAYSKVDLIGSYRIRRTTEIYGRIENLFDREYEEAKGYNTPGFSTYVGLRISF